MDISKKRVQILLSTYNGERFLREQLDSIVDQTYFPQIKVLIRDDGSTDGSLQILEEYRAKYGFTISCGENVGINASYMELFRKADLSCDYFACGDQDDIWFPDKIEMSVHQLDTLSEEIPAMTFGVSLIVDEKLNVIGQSIAPTKGISFFNAMAQNICPGHTQVFNRSLVDLLLRGHAEQSHVMDWWIYLLASGLGKVYFIPRQMVMHRQHGNNAVGYEVRRLNKMLTRIKRAFSDEAASITSQLIQFEKDYGGILPVAYERELQSFINSQKTLKHRLNYIRKAQIFRQSQLENILVRMLYLLGKYSLKGG